MFNCNETPKSLEVCEILEDCVVLQPQDKEILNHAVIKRFGSPLQPIFMFKDDILINDVSYQKPIALPLYNADLEVIQLAILQDGKLVRFSTGNIASGFASCGELKKDKPLIITYGLEAFFKIAATDYPVVLVVLPSLCSQNSTELKEYDFEQINFVINQLVKAGYQQLYIPVRPEHIQLESFQKLKKNSCVKLLNQYLKVDQNEFFIDLSKDEPPEEIKLFIDEAIEQLLINDELPKGYLAKSFKYGEGVFQLLESGLYYIEQTKGDDYRRYISSPIRVLAQTRDTNNNAWGRLLEWHDPDGVKHYQAISLELFQTDGAELRKALAYQGVIIAPDSKARNLLQCYLMSYPTNSRALCVDHVGWYEDVFVLPGGQIGRHATSDLIVYQTTDGLDNNYQSKGLLEQWKNGISIPSSSHSKLILALSSAFAGQLLSPLDYQTGAGIHLKGKSSTGKTTALFVGGSVWGKPSNYCKTWRSTGNALEYTAYLHNDGFLALDEIGEVSNPKEIGAISYMLTNGKGKARLTKQITPKPSLEWKIIFLSSGEMNLKDIMNENGQKTKLGQEIRLIDIDIDQSAYGLFDQIDFAEDGAKQSRLLVERSNQFFGIAGIEWLKYLTDNKRKITDQAKELLEKYHQELIVGHTEGHIIRVANTFALIAVAGELATKAKITGWESGTAFHAVKAIFNNWVRDFEYVGDYETRELILRVKAFLEANESSRFEAVGHEPDHIEKTNNRVGYWKIENGEKLFLILPEQFKKEVCKGVDSRKVTQALMSQGLLEHDNEKSTKTVRLPNRTKSIRVYMLKDEIFSWG